MSVIFPVRRIACTGFIVESVLIRRVVHAVPAVALDRLADWRERDGRHRRDKVLRRVGR